MSNKIKKHLFAHAVDEKIRKSASSGGFCKALFCYMIDHSVVDYVIMPRIKPDSTEPEMMITNNTDEILQRTNSIYEFFNQLESLDNLDDSKTYAIITLGCFAKSIRSRQRRGKMKNIKYILSPLCHQAPTSNFKHQMIKLLTDGKLTSSDLKEIDYRGGPHPWGGEVLIDKSNKEYYKLHHEQAWGKFNGNYQNAPDCCLKCTIEDSAPVDIMVADPWKTIYDATNNTKPGAWTSVSIRTQEAYELVQGSIKHEYINAEEPVGENPDNYKERDPIISGFDINRSRKKRWVKRELKNRKGNRE